MFTSYKTRMNRYELALHFIRSPLGINWSTPRSLLTSAAANVVFGRTVLKGHAIGHVNIELIDRSRNDSIFTGITVSDRRQYFESLVKNRQGFGVLFHRFQGRLESQDEILKSLRKAARQKRLQTLRFHISAEAFARCEQYHQETLQIQDRLQYGFPCEPRRKEGAGCTAFAMSFLEVAGLMRPEFKAWQKKLLVPHDLIGEGHRGVSVGESLKSPLSRQWGSAENSRELCFWDPDMMFQWAKIYRGRSEEVLVDARTIPVPQEPIWLA